MYDICTCGCGETPVSRRKTGTAELRLTILAALVFLISLNLRPALTSVGPLLPQIGDDAGLNGGAETS